MDLKVVQLQNISKSFPGVKALDGVDFSLRAGEIHSLMGENGAGKSTLIKVLTGVHTPDTGSILLEGRPIHPSSPLEAQQLGISTVYQEVNLVPTLSVAENLFLGRFPMKLGRIEWQQVRRRSQHVLERMQLDLEPSAKLGDCSIALQQMVAIARALDTKAKVLVLDEPTSSLDKEEVRTLFELLRRLRSEGMAILFVSHFLDQIYELSDRITVLRNGKLVGAYETAELPRLSLIAKMLGREEAEVESQFAKRPQVIEEVAIQARSLARRGAVGPIEMSVRKGEIVGLAGLLGSGRTEAARLLFGLDRPDSGVVEVEGRPTKLASPRAALRQRLAFLPEDRKIEGILPHLSVRENIVLGLQARRGWLRKIPRAEQGRIVEQYIRSLRISTPSPDTPVGTLSGGNQQKVILARWLASQPKVLILDEPTRGVDVGAKAEIQNLIANLGEDGLAIVLIAAELEDVARESHRVIVLRDRKQVGELTGDEVRLDRIMEMIAS